MISDKKEDSTVFQNKLHVLRANFNPFRMSIGGSLTARAIELKSTSKIV